MKSPTEPPFTLYKLNTYTFILSPKFCLEKIRLLTSLKRVVGDILSAKQHLFLYEKPSSWGYFKKNSPAPKINTGEEGVPEFCPRGLWTPPLMHFSKR